ncbi:MAG: hypothetical protein ACJ8AW_01800 [Rhodopila sp.]
MSVHGDDDIAVVLRLSLLHWYPGFPRPHRPALKNTPLAISGDQFAYAAATIQDLRRRPHHACHGKDAAVAAAQAPVAEKLKAERALAEPTLHRRQRKRIVIEMAVRGKRTSAPRAKASSVSMPIDTFGRFNRSILIFIVQCISSSDSRHEIILPLLRTDYVAYQMDISELLASLEMGRKRA